MRARAASRVIFALLIVAGLAALPATPAAAIPDGSTALIDRPTGFGALPFDGVAQAFNTPYATSADGRYVVFGSNNNNLLDNDDDGVFNVYRVDLQAQPDAIALVSQTKAGTP